MIQKILEEINKKDITWSFYKLYYNHFLNIKNEYLKLGYSDNDCSKHSQLLLSRLLIIRILNEKNGHLI